MDWQQEETLRSSLSVSILLALIAVAIYLQPWGGAPGTANVVLASGSYRASDSYQCSDGIDNDADGLADYPLDPGCSSPTDNDEAGGDSLRKKTYAYLWSEPVYNKTDNFIKFYWLSSKAIPKTMNASYAKQQTDLMPEGNRIIFTWDVHTIMDNHTDDYCLDPVSGGRYPCIWWENGTAEVARRFDSFFKNYSAIGGKLDRFVVDYEGIESGTFWVVGLNNSNEHEVGKWRSIQNDPRFATEIVPRLGFSDLGLVYNSTINSSTNSTIRSWRYQMWWNDVMYPRMAKYLNDSMYVPIKNYYPDVNFSNYAYIYYCDQYPALGGQGGIILGHRSNGAHAGTHQAPSIYASMPLYSPENWTAFYQRPFNEFRFVVNFLRSSYLCSPNVSMHPWISHKEWNGSYLNDSDLYQEMILHALMTGADGIYAWNTAQYWNKIYDFGFTMESMNHSEQLVSSCIREFDLLAGFGDSRALFTNVSDWNDDFMLSGMQAGGRKVWRFAPDLDTGIRLESTLRSTKGGVVFNTSKKIIYIPQGVIYTPPTDACALHEGYWVVQPAGAPPPNIEPTPNQCWADPEACSDIFPPRDLVGYWRFDGDYNDSSGNGYHGVPDGYVKLLPNEGINGTAYFNGSSGGRYSFVRVQGVNRSFSGKLNPLTITFWAGKHNPDVSGTILEIGRNTTLNRYVIFIFSYTSPSIIVNFYNETTQQSIPYYESIERNMSFFAYTVDGAYNYSVYKDAAIRKRGSKDPSILTIYPDKNDLYIGNSYNYWGPWNGTIDEVMIFNRALSQTELRLIYDYQQSLTSPPDNDHDLVPDARDCNDYSASVGRCAACFVCTEDQALSINSGSCALATSEAIRDQEGCPLPRYAKFSPELTTDFTRANMTRARNVSLGITDIGRMEFQAPVSLYHHADDRFSLLDLDQHVIMERNRIGIDPVAIPELDRPAILTFYGVSFRSPKVMKDGTDFSGYALVQYPEADNNYTMKILVTGFSVYEIVEGNHCGDTFCNHGETCSSCQQDCGSCAQPPDRPGPGPIGPSCLQGQTRACSSSHGRCKPGTQACQNGAWGQCIGATGPANETCNGIDDDCNGLIDDGIPCDCINGQTRACGLATGACQPGYRICAGGAWSRECIGEKAPAEEVCGNGIDDDCDGAADEADCIRNTTSACADGPIMQACLCEGAPHSKGYCINGYYFETNPVPDFPWEVVSYVGAALLSGTLLLLVVFEVRRFARIRRQVKPDARGKATARETKGRHVYWVSDITAKPEAFIDRKITIGGYVHLSSRASEKEYWYSLYDQMSTLALRSSAALNEGYLEIDVMLKKTQLGYVYAVHG